VRSKNGYMNLLSFVNCYDILFDAHQKKMVVQFMCSCVQLVVLSTIAVIATAAAAESSTITFCAFNRT